MTSVRNLGVLFDEALCLSPHASNICKSAVFQLRQITRIRDFLMKDATKTIVHSLVTSWLDYCNAVLVGLPDHDIKRLRCIQNAAARLTLNVSKMHLMIVGTKPACRAMQEINIQINRQAIESCNKVKYLGFILDPQLTIKPHVDYIRGKTVGKIKLLSRISNVIKPTTALFLYKSLIRPVFDYCHFQDIRRTHNRTTRLSCSNNFNVPNYKLEMCCRSFMYRGPKVWMQVPLELKLVPSLESFKSGIRALWRFDGDPGIM